MSGLTHFCYATLLLYHFQPKKSKDNFDKNRLVLRSLGQFTRNYTQTVKRAADNKLRLNTEHRKSARCSACFVVRGFQRGLPLGTRLCLQSVVCYTLCRRCCENAVAAGEGKGIFTAGKQGCDCAAWSRKRRTGFISRQGVYECPRPSSYAGLWDKVSQTDSHIHEKTDRVSSQN